MKNLARLTNKVQREQAIKDYRFVVNQINIPIVTFCSFDGHKSARQIDKITRQLINWAKDKGQIIILPDGWSK